MISNSASRNGGATLFDIMFGEGISKMSELIDVGVKLGIVQKSGAWFLSLIHI